LPDAPGQDDFQIDEGDDDFEGDAQDQEYVLELGKQNEGNRKNDGNRKNYENDAISQNIHI
jgi:hypothetical protein